jgi:hypothetical protein
LISEERHQQEHRCALRRGDSDQPESGVARSGRGERVVEVTDMITSYLIAPLESEEFDRLLRSAQYAMGRSNYTHTSMGEDPVEASAQGTVATQRLPNG